MTLLTALTDLGLIHGTDDVMEKSSQLYIKWMRIFGVIRNPVVFFTDKSSVAERMREIRASLPTLVCMAITAIRVNKRYLKQLPLYTKEP